MSLNVDNMQIQFDPSVVLILKFVLGLIMLGVALEIKLSDFKNIFQHPKALLCGLLSQFFFLPLMTYLLIISFKPYPSIALGMMLVAACPGGNVSNLFTMFAKGNTALSVSMTFFSTLLAMVMTPFNISFWASLYPPTKSLVEKVSLDPSEVMFTVIFVLGLPLLIGLSLRHKNNHLADKLQSILKKVSFVFLIVLVVGALFANHENFKNYIHLVLIIVFLHNLIAVSTGFSLATLLKLPARDKKAITFEVGIQNSGLGIALALEFFSELGGVTLVCAWWGVWHSVSAAFLVYIFSKNIYTQKLLRLT